MLKKPDKLYFLTAGMPTATGKGSYPEAFDALRNLDLDGMEFEFVHGIKISQKSRTFAKENGKDLLLTAHGPFYINLNSKDESTTEASVQRIIETARVGSEIGAYSITYHAAYYMGKDKETVYQQVKTKTKEILDVLEQEKINLWIRPETTGKATQWGDFEEIIRLSKEFEQVLPCIDFSHIHARTIGEYNTYDEFAHILDRIGTELGTFALENFHAHIAGIEYGDKGERQHVILKDSDLNYKELLKALKDFGVKGAVVCESPNIEIDAQILKEYYYSL